MILASQSPWRRQILENIVSGNLIVMLPHYFQSFPMEVVPSSFEENLDKSQFAHAWEYVVSTSEGKAIDVASKQKVCLA